MRPNEETKNLILLSRGRYCNRNDSHSSFSEIQPKLQHTIDAEVSGKTTVELISTNAPRDWFGV